MAFQDDYSEEGAGAAIILLMFFILLFFFAIAVLPGAQAVTCNVNVGSVTRQISNTSFGVHFNNMFGEGLQVDSDCSGGLDTYRNATFDRLYANYTGIQAIRGDMDLDNQVSSYTSSNFIVWSTSGQYGNFTSKQGGNTYGLSRGRVTWTMDSPTQRFADNVTQCNSGRPSDFSWANCGWSNYTHAGRIASQFMNDVGCNGSANCWVTNENEPYGSSFLYINGTCDERINYIIAAWPAFYDEVRSRCPSCKIASPSFTVASINSCGGTMARSFMGNYSVGGSYAPDCLDYHSMYSSSGNNFATAYLRGEEAYNESRVYGYHERLCGTEGAPNYGSAPTQGTGALTAAWTYALGKAYSELGMTFYDTYLFSIDSSNLVCGADEYFNMVENRNATGQYFTWLYNATNRTKYLMGSDYFVNATSDDANVSCVAAVNASGQLFLGVTALRAGTTDVTVNLLGGEINGVYVVSNITAASASDNDTVTLPTFKPWGSEIIEINFTQASAPATRYPVLFGGLPVFSFGYPIFGAQ